MKIFVIDQNFTIHIFCTMMKFCSEEVENFSDFDEEI